MHRVIASSSHASIAELERLRRSGMQVDAVDECGLTCLFMAAAGGEREVCEWLVAHGADVDARNPEDGRSPLHAACAAGHVAVAAQLLSAGASSTARDAEGLTPAELAHRALHLDVVRVFVDHSRQELRAAKTK